MGSGGLGQVKWVQNRICEAYPSGGRILDICLSTNTGLKYVYIYNHLSQVRQWCERGGLYLSQTRQYLGFPVSFLTSTPSTCVSGLFKSWSESEATCRAVTAPSPLGLYQGQSKRRGSNSTSAFRREH